MSKEIKINETHLIALKKDKDSRGVSITYLPIVNPLRGPLNDVYQKCEDNYYNKKYVNDILNFDNRLRDVLSVNDFCLELERPWQELEDLSKLKFVYSNNLDKKGLIKEVLEDKKYLMNSLKERELGYAMNLAYESAEGDNNIVAISHRRRGWEYPAFNLINNLSVQFLTNFGYGRKSYFCTKLIYKNIDIVPFSEWIRYKDSRYDEILFYSQDYSLSNQSWQSAMEYVRDAINLCADNEKDFVEKYITSECEWLVNGLNEIFIGQGLNNSDEEIDQIDYKGNKVSGALNFIKSIKEYSFLISVKKFINDIEQLNKDMLPILFHTIGKVNYELYLAESKFSKHKLDYDKKEKKYLPLNNLESRILKIKNNNSSAGVDLLVLFRKKYHNYEKIQTEYREAKNKYDNIERLITQLNRYDSRFKGYIEKINNYFNLLSKEM